MPIHFLQKEHIHIIKANRRSIKVADLTSFSATQLEENDFREQLYAECQQHRVQIIIKLEADCIVLESHTKRINFRKLDGEFDPYVMRITEKPTKVDICDLVEICYK